MNHRREHPRRRAAAPAAFSPPRLARAASSSLLLLLSLPGLLLGGGGGVGLVRACSRVLVNKHDAPVVAGRSMDWNFSFHDVLFLNPPGEKMHGRAGELSVEWTSKYGSVVSSVIGFFSGEGDLAKKLGLGIGPGNACEDWEYEKDGGLDGINTQGLAVHLLYLGVEHGTVYAEHSKSDPVNISYTRWARYVLDNFSTVEEAVAGLSDIVMINDAVCKGAKITDGKGKVFGLHMAMEDATGDSAVIEHVDGKWQIYHSRTDALVMTNKPPYPEQKDILSKFEPWGGNSTLPDNLPGSIQSEDRMVRLEYYLRHSPKPETYVEAIAYVRSLISNTNVPFGAPYVGRGVYPTWWTSFVDNTNKMYFYDWLLTPNLVWVNLTAVDWDSVPGVLQLKPQNIELAGNVLCDFTTLDGEDPRLEQCKTAAPVCVS